MSGTGAPGLPRVVRVYVRNVLAGFALAAVFVAGLLALDVAHLRHLVMADPAGWIAVVMLWVFNGIVFAGVQFGVALMRAAEDPGEDDDAGGGPPVAAVAPVPVPARIGIRTERRRRR